MQEELPVIKSKLTIEEIKANSEREIKKITTYLIPAYMFDCVKEGKEFKLLVDAVTGHIIFDIEKSVLVKFPVVMDFSINELRVIEAAINLGEFTEHELLMKCQLDRDVAENLFFFLLKKELFDVNQGKYWVNKSFDLVFNPEKLASSEIINKINVKYDQKLDKKLDLNEVKDNLAKFVNIVNAEECWVEWHKAEFEQLS